MTKVNNGRIASGTSTRARAAAVLARLDEMSESLADEISHYGDDDATFDLSVKEEAVNNDKAEVSRKKKNGTPMKKLEKVVESNVVICDEEGSCGVESNDDSTVYEEISYGLARLNKSAKVEKASVQKKEHKETTVQREQLVSSLSDKSGGTFQAERKRVKEKVTSNKARTIEVEDSTITPLLPALEGDKNEDLEDLRNMNSCSFDGSDDSSDGFSIEEIEDEIHEEDSLIEKTPVLAPRVSPHAPTWEQQRTSPKKKHEHSIDKYVHSLSLDEGILDDASILDMQMSRTPKIRNNKKVLVGKKNGVGFSGSKSVASIESSSLIPPHLMASGTSASNSAVSETKSIKSAKSNVSAASTEKTDNTRGSWGLFSRAAPTSSMDEAETGTTVKSEKSRTSFGLFSRAAPKADKKTTKVSLNPFDEQSELSQFNPPSHLSIDIESANSGRRGKSRSAKSSSASRVSSALSFGDDAEDIIRAAIVIKERNSARRRRHVICGFLLLFLASIAALVGVVYTNNVPSFLREPLAKAGIIPSPPTSKSENSTEVEDPRGVAGAAWYADFDLYKCVQNCDDASAYTCGGKMKGWEQGFASLEECCLENFSSFIGKDWSLRDCIAVSTNDDEEDMAHTPTYMPTMGDVDNVTGDQDDKEHPLVQETTPFAVKEEGREYIEPSITTTSAPKEITSGGIHQSESGTTPWAVKEQTTENDSSDYVLELDENFNPINPTTAAVTTTTEVQEIMSTTATVTPTKGNHVSVVSEIQTTVASVQDPTNATEATSIALITNMTSNEATVIELSEDSYVLVYYPDWLKNTCLLTGLYSLESWQKSYPTEDECCLDNFAWDVNGKCFKTPRPATESPTSTIAPSYQPTSNPTTQPTPTVLVIIFFNGKCIQVNKSTLKNNAKMYDTLDECHLDHNLGEYQPSVAPTLIPTTAPSFSPTVSPTEMETPAPSMTPSSLPVMIPETTSDTRVNIICATKFCEYEMSSDYKLEYKVNIPADTTIDGCFGCSLSMKLTYDDETSWIGLAFSTDGEMIGSEAVIGVPGMVPAKYYLTGKFETAIQPMEESKQTLINPRIEVVDGQTILSFEKLMKEEGEIEITTGSNMFLWAHGADVHNTYHGQNKGVISVNLSGNNSNRMDGSDSLETKNEITETKTNHPINKPTPIPVTTDPTSKTTRKPSVKPTNRATGKPTAKPTVKLTVRATSNPTIKQSSSNQDPLMEFLLERSPGSAESLTDTTSGQYLAWKWLKKNLDLNSISDERKVQRWVLATLYRSLHGDEWTFQDGWLEISDGSVDECTWYNVLCDSAGYVVSLDLRNNYLWGEAGIPPEISLLQKCEYLGLSSNYLNSIEPAIFSMSNLKVLDMDDNGIQEIPPEFDTSSQLEELYLSHNKIEIIPDAIFELKGLKALYIFDNWISSAIPSKIGQLESLEMLDLEMNYLTGQIPEELYQLTSLKGLWLYSNQLTGQFSTKFSQMSSLGVLDLSQNYLTGALPTEIGLFQNISELHLMNNMFSGQLPTELSALTSLTVLDLSMNYLNSNMISEIGSLANLVTLRLDNNYRLDDNSTLISSGVMGTIPSSIRQLKQLKELRLDNNFIKGPLPSALGELQNLEILRIESNDIDGSIPSELGNAVNLQYLHLWSNYIEGTIPATLGNLVQLKELFLDDNELTGSIPSELGRLTNANYICLASNNLEGLIPSQLGMLPSIEKLEVQSNYLYGEVPKELGSSPLMVLQLEDNFLYGDIPDEICSNNALQYLSGSCPVLPKSTPAPVPFQTNDVSLTQASVSARNGVRANNNVRNRARTGGARTNNGERTNNNGTRKKRGQTKNGRQRGGTRKSQTTRGLAQSVPTPSPTLEYWWSCNCCSECLPVN